MRRIAVSFAMLAGSACTRPEITVVDATYGGECGRAAERVTGLVARACDGRYGCRYEIGPLPAGSSARGCADDFQVTWRCTGDDGVRRAAATDASTPGTAVRLQCDGPAPSRIDVLDAAAGPDPIPGLTAAVVDRCAGATSCTLEVDRLGPLRYRLVGAPPLHVHWRCEGEMVWRDTLVAPSAQLSCD